MHLFRSRLAQEVDYLAARRAAYYRVIYEHDSLVLYGLAYRAELYPDQVYPLLLTGCDKGSAYVLVFYEAHAVGYSRGLGIAQSGVYSRIGDAHDDTRGDGMGP